jgi:hypothetical protein
MARTSLAVYIKIAQNWTFWNIFYEIADQSRKGQSDKPASNSADNVGTHELEVEVDEKAVEHHTPNVSMET